jgi:hypothetical protein
MASPTLDTQAKLIASLVERIERLERNRGAAPSFGFTVTRSAVLGPLATGSVTNIPWDVVVQSAGGWIPAAGASGFSAPSFVVPAGGAGAYVLAAGTYDGATTQTYLAIRVNGLSRTADGYTRSNDRHTVMTAFYLAEGDVVQLVYGNNSGAAVNLVNFSDGATFTTFLSVWRVSS